MFRCSKCGIEKVGASSNPFWLTICAQLIPKTKKSETGLITGACRITEYLLKDSFVVVVSRDYKIRNTNTVKPVFYQLKICSSLIEPLGV